MYDCRIFKVMIIFQIFPQLRRVYGLMVIFRIVDRFSSVYFYKVAEPFSVYAVVYYKHFVALFGKGSAGRFKTENTLAR